MAEPPVARIMATSRWRMRLSVASMVGMVMQETRFSLPPVSATACRMTLTVSRMQRRAVGWGENTMALPALMAISAL